MFLPSPFRVMCKSYIFHFLHPSKKVSTSYLTNGYSPSAQNKIINRFASLLLSGHRIAKTFQSVKGITIDKCGLFVIRGLCPSITLRTSLRTEGRKNPRNPRNLRQIFNQKCRYLPAKIQKFKIFLTTFTVTS